MMTLTLILRSHLHASRNNSPAYAWNLRLLAVTCMNLQADLRTRSPILWKSVHKFWFLETCLDLQVRLAKGLKPMCLFYLGNVLHVKQRALLFFIFPVLRFYVFNPKFFLLFCQFCVFFCPNSTRFSIMRSSLKVKHSGGSLDSQTWYTNCWPP